MTTVISYAQIQTKLRILLNDANIKIALSFPNLKMC